MLNESPAVNKIPVNYKINRCIIAVSIFRFINKNRLWNLLIHWPSRYHLAFNPEPAHPKKKGKIFDFIDRVICLRSIRLSSTGWDKFRSVVEL